MFINKTLNEFFIFNCIGEKNIKKLKIKFKNKVKSKII